MYLNFAIFPTVVMLCAKMKYKLILDCDKAKLLVPQRNYD
jgi:hypothetical protein